MQDLGEYDWNSELEADRFWEPDPLQDANDRRSPFERDRARIIHSVGFRRLQGKTQIFSSSTDFLRTRLTHSIEVAQIGRAMALRFKVPESLVEAACLGHDLGHPPFGHTGEEVLAARMNKVSDDLKEDTGSFEGNAQSFRLVTRLEQKSAGYVGLDLSRATLLGLLKYPYRRDAGLPKFLYQDDAEAYTEWLFDGSGHTLLEEVPSSGEPPRTFPCQVMDWADDIAYSVHDLEDGIASEMLQPWRWRTDAFIAEVTAGLQTAPIRWGSGTPPNADEVAPVIDDLASRLTERLHESESVPLDVMRDVTRHYINKFANAPTLKVTGPGSSQFDFQLDIPEEIRIENQILKTITFEFVVNDAETRRLSFKGQEILRRLFRALYRNLRRRDRSRLLLFPRSMRPGLETLSESQAARAVCDYLASMTEGQALSLYAHLFEPSVAAEFGHV